MGAVVASNISSWVFLLVLSFGFKITKDSSH